MNFLFLQSSKPLITISYSKNSLSDFLRIKFQSLFHIGYFSVQSYLNSQFSSVYCNVNVIFRDIPNDSLLGFFLFIVYTTPLISKKPLQLTVQVMCVFRKGSRHGRSLRGTGRLSPPNLKCGGRPMHPFLPNISEVVLWDVRSD